MFPTNSDCGVEYNNSEFTVEEQKLCVFCKVSLDSDTVSLTAKGCDTLNKASISLKDEIKVKIGQVVHQQCRLFYYKKSQSLTKKNNTVQAPTNTVTDGCTNICFFCGKPAKASHKAGKGNDISEVKTQNFQETILKHIEERQDEWASEVKSRIGALDLRSSKSLYHKKCDSTFRQKPSTSTVGRPQNECRQEAFLKVVEFMNGHEGDAFTITDLIKVMKRECKENVEEYCGKFLKKKLVDHFGENICFLQSKGKPDYIIFRHSANSIISEFRQKTWKTTEAQRRDVLETAGKLIVSDISSTCYDKDEYPSSDKMSCIEDQLDFLPDSIPDKNYLKINLVVQYYLKFFKVNFVI